MATHKHLEILKQGTSDWNSWRIQHPRLRPNLHQADLTGADLSEANLSEANLIYADLSKANLREAKLIGAQVYGANLSKADLREATFSQSDFSKANLSKAHLKFAYLNFANLSGTNLFEADLSYANLSGTDLSGADLSGADLRQAILVGTNLTKATLKDCYIYGISVWDIQLDEAEQINLCITQFGEPDISVDNLKVAQFIYLLLNNSEIREVIDTIAKKAVLILGRFTPERKTILDALRDALRQHEYLPILFDFEKPASRDITETVSTLAHLARFVIADITDAKSIPQELMIIVPTLPSLAVQPLILASQHEYGMFEHFTRYPWVLPVYRYTDEASLLKSLQEKIITPAEQRAKELENR